MYFCFEDSLISSGNMQIKWMSLIYQPVYMVNDIKKIITAQLNVDEKDQSFDFTNMKFEPFY